MGQAHERRLIGLSHKHRFMAWPMSAGSWPGHEHRLMGLAHEHWLMHLAHEHKLKGLANEHILIGDTVGARRGSR